MSRVGFVVNGVILTASLAAGISRHAVGAELISTSAPPKTEVVVIGTLHEFHETNQYFSNAHPDLAELAGESAFIRDEWTGRNRLMAANVTRIGAQYRGRRMVVLAGAEHRYLLRELLNLDPKLALREFWEFGDAQPQASSRLH